MNKSGIIELTVFVQYSWFSFSMYFKLFSCIKEAVYTFRIPTSWFWIIYSIFLNFFNSLFRDWLIAWKLAHDWLFVFTSFRLRSMVGGVELFLKFLEIDWTALWNHSFKAFSLMFVRYIIRISKKMVILFN